MLLNVVVSRLAAPSLLALTLGVPVCGQESPACVGTLPDDILAGIEGSAVPDGQWFLPISRRFKPTKPTVSIAYNAEYRFLGVSWKRLACATIMASEGIWTDRNGSATSACLVELTLSSPDRVHSKEERTRNSFSTRMVSVLTMPDLESLAYVKETEAVATPRIGKVRHVSNVQAYITFGATFRFISKDFLSGTLCTNMPDGAADLLRQGQQVSSVLKVISSAYYGRSEMLTPDSNFRMYMNIDGVVRPLVVTTRKTRAPIRLGDTNPDCLEIAVQAAKDAPVEKRYFSMCAVSLRDVARLTKNDDIAKLAEGTIETSMVPLSVDHALACGYVRCWMQGIACTNRQFTLSRQGDVK